MRRPPSHYELLGLSDFEEDLEKIRRAAQMRSGRVQKEILRDRPAEAQEVLDQLHRALACLTGPRSKQDYDKALMGDTLGDWVAEGEPPRRAEPVVAQRPPPPAKRIEPQVRTKPPPAGPPSPASRPSPPPLPRPTWKLPAWPCWVAGGVCLLGWLGTSGHPPGNRYILPNYILLAAACVALVKAVQTRWFPVPVFYAAAPALAIAALIVHAATDTYTTMWTAIEDPETYELTETATPVAYWGSRTGREISRIRYRDTYKRWGDRFVHRRIDNYDNRGHVTRSFAGPMSESGKPHGPWELALWDSHDRRLSWYWYGEKITEGEWHLRNR